MILQSFFVFLPALLAGFGLIHLLWTPRGNGWALGIKLFLGAGLGLGLASCLYFFRLVFFPGQGGYLFIELGLLIAVLVVLFWQRRLTLNNIFRFPSFSWMQVFLALSTLFVLYIAVGYSLALIRNSPHGDYDAQAIWNLRARSMYRSGETWENAFSPGINRNFHMDYPLLTPSTILGGWDILGGEVLRVPAILSMLFLYGTGGIVFCLIAYSRTETQAFLALMLLLATPSLLFTTAFQSADVVVAYYFLSTTALLILSFNEDEPNLLILAGVMSALSAWTKNEGIPFLFITILFAAWMLWMRNLFARFRNMLAGMFFPVATILLFKVHLPVSRSNDLFTDNGFTAILLKMIDPARYETIVRHLISEFIHLGDWHFSVIVVLLIYGMVVGLRKTFGDKGIDLWIIIIPLAQSIVYFGVYLSTPYDLIWHMNYSMGRLLIHLFPMAILSFFMIVNTPEEALGQSVKTNTASIK